MLFYSNINNEQYDELKPMTLSISTIVDNFFANRPMFSASNEKGDDLTVSISFTDKDLSICNFSIVPNDEPNLLFKVVVLKVQDIEHKRHYKRKIIAQIGIEQLVENIYLYLSMAETYLDKWEIQDLDESIDLLNEF